jgi:hypothetical protein
MTGTFVGGHETHWEDLYYTYGNGIDILVEQHGWDAELVIDHRSDDPAIQALIDEYFDILCDNIEKELTDEHQEAADDNQHITLKLSKDEHVAVLRYEYIEVISSSEGFPGEVIALLKEHAYDKQNEG